MTEPTNWLVHDHDRFDAMLDECEYAAGAGEWQAAIRMFGDFTEALKLHMRMEDEVLYPLFVEETGDPDGEITILGEEHDDIVRLLRDLSIVIRHKDYDHFGDSLAPLHKVMREHNDHEEAVFTRMGTDSVLNRRDEILARLNAIKPGDSQRHWGF